MADSDKKNANAANTKGDATKVTSSKGALRRKVAGRGQTSLSSRTPMIVPDEAHLSPKLSSSEAGAVAALGHASTKAVEPTVDAQLAKGAAGRPRKVAAEPARRSDVSPPAVVPEPVKAIEPASAELSPKPGTIEAEPSVIQPEPEPQVLAAEIEPAQPPEITKATRPNPSSDSSIKDMTMDMSANFNGFQGAMSEAQAKAQAAFEKSSSMLNEAGDFAKGNVEAMIESSKILAEGVQSMGSSMVSEGRTAFEAMTGDLKELAAAKSPTDFFKLQSELVRKNFDTVVAQSSKNTETMLKLMSDACAPMSGRVSLAVEKARQVAPMKMPMTANV